MRLPKHTQDERVNGRIQVIGPSLLESQKMKVWHELDCVKVEIGGHVLTMEYPTAVKMSQMIRTHAKQAKKFAGDSSKGLLTEAVLSDAEENYRRGW